MRTAVMGERLNLFVGYVRSGKNLRKVTLTSSFEHRIRTIITIKYAFHTADHFELISDGGVRNQRRVCAGD